MAIYRNVISQKTLSLVIKPEDVPETYSNKHLAFKKLYRKGDLFSNNRFYFWQLLPLAND